ncbi:MAG: polyprenyl synthetase family protein [Bdellovibrionota bacterium]
MISQKALFDDFFHHRITSVVQSYPAGARTLTDSVLYSLFQNSKRFRPTLSLLTAEMLGVSHKRALPWAASVEMIHTYSLIHDDLPCMDNDSMRRGEPTNHIVFGESTALLAGDTLLTESFGYLAREYKDLPEIAIELIQLLSHASGGAGMIAGQVIDLGIAQSAESLQVEKLMQMHRLKTGALIHVSVMGIATIARAGTLQKDLLSTFADNLGMAFQLADDLHDYNPDKPERTGYPALIGVQGTKDQLRTVSETAIESLRAFGEKSQPLVDLVRYNQSRLT